MTAPWQLLANVEALNNPQAPFSYWVDRDAIVGHWFVAKITSLGIGSVLDEPEVAGVEPAVGQRLGDHVLDPPVRPGNDGRPAANREPAQSLILPPPQGGLHELDHRLDQELAVQRDAE